MATTDPRLRNVIEEIGHNYHSSANCVQVVALSLEFLKKGQGQLDPEGLDNLEVAVIDLLNLYREQGRLVARLRATQPLDPDRVLPED